MPLLLYIFLILYLFNYYIHYAINYFNIASIICISNTFFFPCLIFHIGAIIGALIMDLPLNFLAHYVQTKSNKKKILR